MRRNGTPRASTATSAHRNAAGGSQSASNPNPCTGGGSSSVTHRYVEPVGSTGRAGASRRGNELNPHAPLEAHPAEIADPSQRRPEPLGVARAEKSAIDGEIGKQTRHVARCRAERRAKDVERVGLVHPPQSGRTPLAGRERVRRESDFGRRAAALRAVEIFEEQRAPFRATRCVARDDRAFGRRLHVIDGPRIRGRRRPRREPELGRERAARKRRLARVELERDRLAETQSGCPSDRERVVADDAECGRRIVRRGFIHRIGRGMNAMRTGHEVHIEVRTAPVIHVVERCGQSEQDHEPLVRGFEGTDPFKHLIFF